MDVQEAYYDLEQIVTQGFLCFGMVIGDNYFIYKTLTDKEYKNIKYYTPDDNESLFILYRLCFGTFMINGNNYVLDRERKIGELKDFYSKMQNVLATVILDNMKKVQNRYLKSLDYFEGFCYTSRSRYLWKILNRSNPVSQDFHGLKGLKYLGLNSVQENWILINNQLDKEDEYETQFHLATMIASSQNPKGAKTVSKNYEFKKNEQQQVRESIAKYGYDKKRIEEEKKQSKWSAPIKTNEDLVRELNRQMSGEKDQHDLFIEQWIRMQKEKAEKAKKEITERQKRYRKDIEGIDLDQEGSRVASSEEADKLKDPNRSKLPYKGVTKSLESYRSLEDEDRFMRKISSRVIKSNKQE